MTSFGKALARIMVAGSLLASGIGAAQAAGALAVGACGAYGFAYDYKQQITARSAALAKCKGDDCKVVTARKRGCAAGHRREQCLWRTRLCGCRAARPGAEHGVAPVLPFWRQGLRHPRLCLRRQGLTAAAQAVRVRTIVGPASPIMQGIGKGALNPSTLRSL
jgi:hypothetical protein